MNEVPYVPTSEELLKLGYVKSSSAFSIVHEQQDEAGSNYRILPDIERGVVTLQVEIWSDNGFTNPVFVGAIDSQQQFLNLLDKWDFPIKHD